MTKSPKPTNKDKVNWRKPHKYEVDIHGEDFECKCGLKEDSPLHINPTKTSNKKWGVERVAMNIVYQIGDVLEADVDKRQATNDKAIDFTMTLINSLLQQQRNETISKVEGIIGKDEEVCPADIKKELEAGCSWCHDRKNRNELRKEQRKTLSQVIKSIKEEK